MTTLRGNTNHNGIGLKAFIICCLYSSTLLAAPTNDSSDVDPTSQPKTPKTIITLRSGYSSSSATNITIDAACPLNFTPYVTVSGASYGSAGNPFAGRSVCVRSATQTASTVQVSIVSQIKYKPFSNVTMINGGSDSRWVSDNPNSWTIWDAQTMPINDTISSNPTIADEPNNLFWVLYCYPSGSTPPAYSCP
jgi:hypothetical protein